MTAAPAPDRQSLRAMLILLRPYRLRLSLAMLAGIVSGFAMTALLATISTAIGGQASAGLAHLLLAYCGAGLLAIAASVISDLGTNAVGQRLVADLRCGLSEQILHAPIDQLERYRLHRLQTVLNGDIDMISMFAFNVAPLSAALAITLGCLAWLAWLAPLAFLIACACLILSALVQSRVRDKGIAGFERARDDEDRLQHSFNALALGAKELRLDRPRRLALFTDEIRATAQRIRHTQMGAIGYYALGRSAGSLLFFGMIAVLLSWRDTGFASGAVLGSFVLILLYVKGPIDQLIGTLPVIHRAQIAFGRIADLSRRFHSAESDLLTPPHEQATPAFIGRISLRNASYRFTEDRPDHRNGFTLGPVDLDIPQGRITFITGDNGSGKTTLLKILLGLYLPQNGALELDGMPVTDANRDDYRQLFASVLSDFHLFRQITGNPTETQARHAAELLDLLGLTGKVAIREDAFSTTDLSTGQRKRLAFVQACVTGRPVLVFDEWAADQDPAFRHLFYTRLLPDLRRDGRTLIVISHDDRYFHIADQRLHMSAGRIVTTEHADTIRQEGLQA
ncbi:cyclic peptide export ABC transporter [Paracoccus onubensis]|uniref:Cyclic peptide export ABC transporter n=1 Tax=Paracoccus onubensis TaxID=1675788 RepID=A0A418SY54_9RHOB|nr:cyclic peptide export ABC transporter [Paracoccus onubensis]RJE85866.1 cyclic peptide export ABC transporter [Paracoccus onubensis]